MADNKSYEDKEVVVFLLWIDVLERLDTLLLELRHTQTNIIHQIKEPIFYKPLRDEEKYLWGSDPKGEKQPTGGSQTVNGKQATNDDKQQTACGALSTDDLECWHKEKSREELIKIINKWIESYPAIEDRLSESENSLEDRLYTIWEKRLWTRDQCRYYNILRVAQELKKNILQDKIIAFQRGYSALNFYPDSTKNLEDAQSRFMILRVAIIQKARNYVERIGDLQGQFERIVDMGLQDHPRPLMARRREQGIYSGFLADRCQSFEGELHLLLNHLNSPKEETSSVKTPLMHRWAHNFTSNARIFQSDFYPKSSHTSKENVGNSEQNRIHYVNFINSSYWMVERPDLQSALAHEVAHTVIFNRYQDFRASALNHYSDSFSRLIKLLNHCFEEFQVAENGPSLRPKNLLREIGCDLLAASVEGISYLLTVVLELLAMGLEDIFYHPEGRIDLEFLDILPESINREIIDGTAIWYYRTLIIVKWIRITQHRADQVSALESTLLDGVEDAVRSIYGYLSKVSPDLCQSYRFWEVLTLRLTEIIEESDAAKEVRAWRMKRGSDFYSKNGSKIPKKLFPRSTRRLPDEVREHFFDVIKEIKSSEDHVFYQVQGDISKKFDEFYLGKEYQDPSKKPLFQHHYDIPWQCSVMRAIDFLHKEPPNQEIKMEKKNWSWFLKQVHCNITLGREIYSLAMEFQISNTRTSLQFLSKVIELVESSVDENSHSDLNIWLGRNKHKGEDDDKSSIKDCLSEVVKFYELYCKRCNVEEVRKKNHLTHHMANKYDEFYSEEREKILERWPAKTLLKIHPSVSANSRKNFLAIAETIKDPYFTVSLAFIDYHPLCRFIEKIIGYKLMSLYDMKKDSDNPVFKRLNSYLWYKSKSERKEENSLNLILRALSAKKSKFSKRIMLGKISISGANSGYPAEEIKDDRWHIDGGLCQSSEQNEKKSYQFLTGRYDILSLLSTRPMCRCELPRLSKNEGSKDRWPFFVRRELVVPVRLNLEQDWPKTEMPILGLLSIGLGQRESRLIFLARLLRACQKQQPGNGSRDELKCLEGIGPLFAEKDRLLLSEGWGDLLILFDYSEFKECEEEEKLNRLINIYKIQDLIYEDFQVDRTELMPSSSALAIAARSEKFHITIQFRIREDRGMGAANRSFVKKMQKNLKGLGVKKEDFCIERTPGRTDFSVSFAPGFGNRTSIDFSDFSKIWGYNGSEVDITNTIIGWVEGSEPEEDDNQSD